MVADRVPPSRRYAVARRDIRQSVDALCMDDPIAVIPDPAPVGEPIILLLFALLYVAYKYRRKVKS